MDDPMLVEWSDFTTRPESRELVRWLRSRALDRLTGCGREEKLTITPPRYFGRLGIFVTLKRGTMIRGCYGAFSHGTSDIASLLSDYLTGAMTRDPRYKPLDISELAETDIIMTVTSPPFAVNSLYDLDAGYYGFLLQCPNGEISIYVPAEIRQISYIERKARDGSCQISAFKAVTIR
ncbi:MAG: AMMECR1 domain-containing protein [Chrysiogenales bacterium]|nr:MAG: AMMECR1 domain-containing protein [Chrysiogenales bacterium]